MDRDRIGISKTELFAMLEVNEYLFAVDSIVWKIILKMFKGRRT